MYNLLIVDDEQEIRNGLKLKMDWSGLGFRVVGEAADGREAMDMLAGTAIHFMITDIRMPVMSGLELLKQCAEKYPDLKTVVLSGHEDFHYVKAALQCGASDYLLKPVVRGELKAVLAKIRERLDEEAQARSERDKALWQLRQSLPVMQERLMLELVSEEDETAAGSARGELLLLPFDPAENETACLRFIGIEMRLPPGRLGDKAKEAGLLREAFRMVCRETAQQPPWDKCAFAFHHPGHSDMMHILLRTRFPGDDGVLQPFLRQLRDNIDRYLQVESVIAVGEPVTGVASLRKAFLSSLQVWSQSKPGAFSQILTERPSQDVFVVLSPEAEKRLAMTLEDGDAALFDQTLKALPAANELPLHGIASLVLRVTLLLDHAVRRHRLTAIDTSGWMLPEVLWKHTSAPAAFDYLSGLAAQVAEGVRRSRATGGAGVVEAVRKYMEENYMTEMSLSMMADRFHINTTYLSELFKRQTGATFSDYLAQIRLAKTAELLLDPQLRLSDIAELVGFASSSYLSSVFKKVYGISPNDYRNRPVNG